MLLQGTGGVSIFALQIAKLFGAESLITSGSDEKLARAMATGGRRRRELSDDARTGTSGPKAQTGGVGVDHVVEVGGAGTLERSFKAVRTGGHIALIGVLAGVGFCQPDADPDAVAEVRGIFVGSRAMFEDMNRAFELHQTRPVLDLPFNFDDFPTALRTWNREPTLGRSLLGSRGPSPIPG